MDVDAVLLSVQERDKWRRRLALLERTLTEIRDHRSGLQLRVRRLRKELSALGRISEAVLDETVRRPLGRTIDAAQGHYPRR